MKERDTIVQKGQEKVESVSKWWEVKGTVEMLNGTNSFAYIRDQYGLTGRQVSELKQVLVKAIVDGQPSSITRIFDPVEVQKKGVDIKNFNSLSGHPELILYEGYYFDKGNGSTADTFLEKRKGLEPTLLEKKMMAGAVTEPVEVEKKQSGFMKFLSHGGFLLIVVGILIIVVVIVLLTSRR